MPYSKVSVLNIEDFRDLRNYLCAQGHIGPSDKISCQRLPGGVSNRTVLVKLPQGRSIVLKQALAKLRVDVSWFSDPQRIHVEAQALRWLPKLAPPGSTPGFVFEDFENDVLAMEAVSGPSENWKSLLLLGTILPAHFAEFATLIGTIHRNAFERSQELDPVFNNLTFFESLRLEPYYLYSAEQIPEAAGFLVNLVAETKKRRITLVHGDYSPKNVLISHGKLILLDYEVVHFGDPAFDLGFSLTHFLSKGHKLEERRADFLSAAQLYWQTYQRTIEDSPISAGLELRVVHHTLGCLLARVAGRSPLEYLGPEHRRRQREIVCSLMRKPPSAVSDLITEFAAALESHAANR